MTLVALEHQEMNVQVKVTRRTLHTIAYFLMLHVNVLELYFHSVLMYTTYHIFPVLPIKDMIYEDGYLTTPIKLVTGKKHSVSHLNVSVCPCDVQKATAHIGTKTLNMLH